MQLLSELVLSRSQPPDFLLSLCQYKEVPNLPHGMTGWNKLQLSFLPSPSTDIPFKDLLKNW